MKILAVTANFPPEHMGGYGLRISNILDALALRGHKIRLLTTRSGALLPDFVESYSFAVVHRLHLRHSAKFFPKEVLYDVLDTRLLEKHIRVFNPDVIYLGHTYPLFKGLLPYLAGLNIPIYYDEGGTGLIKAWTEHGRWFRFTGDYKSRFALLNTLKPLVIRIVYTASRGRIKPQWSWPENMQVFFNSDLNRQNALHSGVPTAQAEVIHSGIDTAKFTFKPRPMHQQPLKILVPGRIEKRKGQKDAVEVLKQLFNTGIEARITLAGPTWTDGYYEELIGDIQKSLLSEYVTILPMQSTDEMVTLYHDADICLFSSYFRTGFSRVPLEAMATGCLMISYGNEGSDEIIEDRKNGYLVSAGDYQKIAGIIKKCQDDPSLVQTITQAARQLVEEQLSMDIYVDKIEKILFSTVKKS